MGSYRMRAKEIMQVEIATILDDATVAEAADLMRLEGVRSLIVVPHDKLDSFAIITYSDIVKKVIANGHNFSRIQVHEIMTKPAITISPDMEVIDIARLFRQTGIGHAPVVDGNELKGMVSMTDLITEVIAEPD